MCIRDRNYDEWAASEIPGQLFFNREYPQFSYSRRLNTRLAVARTAFFDMTGPKRDAFYEKQLLHNLAWYCPFPPQLSDSSDDSTEQTWTFWCDVPEHPDTPLELVVRAGNPTVDNVATTFERICVQYETAFAQFACTCCQSPKPCPRCRFAVGFHLCPRSDSPSASHADSTRRWAVGSLHSGKHDLKVALWGLIQRNVPLDSIRTTIRTWVTDGSIADSEEATFMREAADMRDCQRTRSPLCGRVAFVAALGTYNAFTSG